MVCRGKHNFFGGGGKPIETLQCRVTEVYVGLHVGITLMQKGPVHLPVKVLKFRCKIELSLEPF